MPRADAAHGQRQGVALGIAQQAAAPDGVNAREQTRSVQAVGLFHQVLARGLGKTLGHQRAAHHRRRGREQALRVMLRKRRQLMAAAVQDAVLKRIDAVAVFGHLGVMGNHDHGHPAGVAERAEILHDQAAGASVQRTRGLVGQQNARIVDHGAGNGHALLLAAGQAVAAVMHPGRKAHQFQGADHPLPAFLRRYAFINQGKFNILKHRGVLEKIAGLHHKAHVPTPEGGGLLAGEGEHIRAQNVQRTGVGRVQHAQNVQHGGLAAARGAHDGHQFTGLHFNVHAAQDRREPGVTLI